KTYERLVAAQLILWKKTTRLGKKVWWPYVKYYAEGRTKRPSPLWMELEGNKKASRDLRAIFGSEKKFDFPKPVEMIERILQISTDKDSIVLDSFAGSGTTAHAVLRMNATDGGNRKFILIEMMDYAETLTAERVKRVIEGYGEGNNAVEGTGGGFGFYELGKPMMVDGNLNEDLPVERIREYVWHMETRERVNVANGGMLSLTNVAHDPYLLGVADGTAYYFCYEKETEVKLNRALLGKLKTRAERYVVYADICLLDDLELGKCKVTFKKIPRDIARL
ncbi:MAG: site-specific DNA-methyltransferase, partial [Kiritimatiellae bacterium]|nr:site-specific DNA-methyltransferase [Kiritimatiellia bacterium]